MCRRVFGAAMIKKSDLRLVIANTNHAAENPVWHGEVHTLKKYYEMPEDQRTPLKDCFFLATHEPCSLCLSAITWAGLDNFSYLFSYDDGKDAYGVPLDVKILEAVFKVRHALLLLDTSMTSETAADELACSRLPRTRCKLCLA
jgi:tRNA(Arg) A34 adenosine deaminase TadA